MKKTLIALSIFLGFYSLSYAQAVDKVDTNKELSNQQNNTQSIEQKSQDFAQLKVSDILKKFQKEPKAKYTEIIQNDIYPHVEWRLVGNRVLGKYNRQMSTEQRQKFDTMFQKLLLSAYVSIVDTYKDSSVKILKATSNNELVTVKMKLIGNNGSVAMDLVLIYKDNAFKILDVVVDSISFMEVYRTGFAQELQHKGIEEFLKSLEEKINSKK